MTNAEISRRLALALGWDVLPLEDSDEAAIVLDHVKQIDRYFDYRDPTVIWPIAERYNRWPRKEGDVWVCDQSFTASITADTAAKAVALAVIKAHEGS